MLDNPSLVPCISLVLISLDVVSKHAMCYITVTMSQSSTKSQVFSTKPKSWIFVVMGLYDDD